MTPAARRHYPTRIVELEALEAQHAILEGDPGSIVGGLDRAPPGEVAHPVCGGCKGLGVIVAPRDRALAAQQGEETCGRSCSWCGGRGWLDGTEADHDIGEDGEF
jgi:hypothetical protein